MSTKEPIKIEDHPEEEVLIVNGVAFMYSFFTDFKETYPVGSFLRVIDRKSTKYGTVLALSPVMSMAEMRAQQPRLVIPGGKRGRN